MSSSHTKSATSSPWKYPVVLESGKTIELESGRDYYWKRSDSWQWNGQEHWWEYAIEIYPGMNGGCGVYVFEKSKWNGASEWQFKTPNNLSYDETCKLFRELVAHLPDEDVSK